MVRRSLKALVNTTFVLVMLAPGFARAAGSDYNFNVRFSPLGLFIGLIGIEADYRVGNQFTVGPTLSFVNSTIGDLTIKGYSIGVRGNYHFDQAFEDGWYVSPSVQWGTGEASVARTNTTNATTASFTGFSFAAPVGYHWFWDNVNLSLGIGPSFTTAPATVQTTDPTTGQKKDVNTGRNAVGVAFDFMFGVAF